MKTPTEKLLHHPSGSPRNNTPVSPQSRYTAPNPLPKMPTTYECKDVNNGQKNNKPSAEKGGYIFTPTSGNYTSHKMKGGEY